MQRDTTRERLGEPTASAGRVAGGSGAPSRAVTLAIKRSFDVAGSAVLLAALAPVMGAAALAIRATMGAPAVFRQTRPGLHGRPFTMLKFRTMRDPEEGEAVYFRTDEQRLTALGRFLRRTSIDELPELWNVLRGDMSLVGPRPLLLEYLPKYTPEQMRRHQVRPGITGWAQVHGRQTILFSERLALDVWYVDHLSLALDLRILAMTLLRVLRSDGVIPGQSVDEVDDLGLSRP